MADRLTAQPSPASGPEGVRARVGFRPNTPQAEAGMRIEPPPSVACAIGKMRAATQAAAPPDDPPALCARFHGLRQAPNIAGSVDVAIPSSGVDERPKMFSPEARWRSTIVLSWSATQPSNSFVEAEETVPVSQAPRSFSRKGTPPNGPAAVCVRATSRARSNSFRVMALSAESRCSARSIAASSTSSGVSSRRAIRPARSVASRWSYSGSVVMVPPFPPGPKTAIP